MTASRADNLLERIAWEDLDERVRANQRNREVHSPGISVFRWWARRPHALIGSILDAAKDEGLKSVSDPFSGGGTVAMECARRGYDVYAQDLHPWATTGLTATLDAVDPEELAAAGRTWLDALEPERQRLYGTSQASPAAEDPTEVITTFWVRTARCPACSTVAHLFPYPLVSLASRSRNETEGFFGCRGCGSITRSGLHSKDRRCSSCRRSLRAADRPNLPGGIATCLSCGTEFPAFGHARSWLPVMVQRRTGGAVHFNRPTKSEAAAAVRHSPELPAALEATIPEGIETRRLRISGVDRWADLYPPRQLSSLLTASRRLDELDIPPEIRVRLRLIVCGAAEMAGYVSRWDRYYPKAFEATANHRYNLTGFAAETNLLSDRGRGTLPRRLAQSVRAARSEHNGRPAARLYSSRRARRLTKAERTGSPSVVTGSSSRQLLPDASVDLVLTDPPYFDDIQYAELAALFLAWARATSLVSDSIELDLRSEAVPNAVRGLDAESYCRLLKRVLAETARTLRPGGRMVLTFHNTEGRAWWALARALGHAGFVVSAVAVAHAENETDHAKRGRTAFSRDLVLETQLASSSSQPVIASSATAGESAELIAAGRTVAKLCGELAARERRRTWSYQRFGDDYRSFLGESPRRYIRLGGPLEEPLPDGQRHGGN